MTACELYSTATVTQSVFFLGGAECLSTSLDLERICSEVMTAKSPCLVGLSDDAGRLSFNLFFILHCKDTIKFRITN